jgi:hypothetical protein
MNCMPILTHILLLGIKGHDVEVMNACKQVCNCIWIWKHMKLGDYHEEIQGE